MKIFSFFRVNKKNKGQSLVELALVVGLLAFLMVAVVEYGFLLNRYLNLLDGVREASRYGSNVNPFNLDYTIDPNFFVRPDLSRPVGPTNPPGLADLVEQFIQPVTLDPTRDDIVISFWGVTENGQLKRFPDADGWSRYGNATSKFTDAMIQARLQSGAPATGVLLIELFYNYPQTLKLPVFSNIIPDPIPLYAYTIMPLPAAEPTPTPIP
jgi:hypothetical protein